MPRGLAEAVALGKNSFLNGSLTMMTLEEVEKGQ